MARGDFRSSVGTVIDGNARQVHNTNGAIPHYRPVTEQPDFIGDGLVNGLSSLTTGLQKRDERQKAEAKRRKELAEYEAEQAEKRKTAERLGTEKKILGKRQDARTIELGNLISQKAATDPSFLDMSNDDIIKYLGDEYIGTNLEGITDENLKSEVMALDRENFDLVVTKARVAYGEAKDMRVHGALAQQSAIDDSYEDLAEIYQDGANMGLQPSSIYVSLTSGALTAAHQGNFQAAENLHQFAMDNIEDPELKKKILKELSPIMAMNKVAKQKATAAQWNALEDADSVEKVLTIIDQMPEGSVGEKSKASYIRRAERVELKANITNTLKNQLAYGAITLDEFTEQLGSEYRTASYFEGSETSVKFTSEEVTKLRNEAFLSTVGRMTADGTPMDVAMLREADTAPQIVSSGINEMFKTGLGTDMQELANTLGRSTNFNLFRVAVDAVGAKENPFGQVAEFSQKFGVSDDHKGIVALIFSDIAYQKAHNEDGSVNVEDAVIKAMDTAKRNREFATYEPAQSYRTSLQALFKDEETPVEVRNMAATYLENYKAYMTPDAAAQAALQEATHGMTEVDGIPMVNGKFYQKYSKNIVSQYQSLTLDEAIENFTEDFDWDVQHMSFNPVPEGNGYNRFFSTIAFTNDEGRREHVSLLEFEKFMRDKYKDRTAAAIAERQDREREEKARTRLNRKENLKAAQRVRQRNQR